MKAFCLSTFLKGEDKISQNEQTEPWGVPEVVHMYDER